jgi:hypothetical protein
MPFLFFFHYIFTPIEAIQVAGPSSLAIKGRWRVLPIISIVYLIPHFASYLHPSLEQRHFWDWIWQPFPILAGILFELLSLPAALSTTNRNIRPEAPTVTIAFFAIISSAVYIYTLLNSNLSPLDLFIPTQLIPPREISLAVRSALQWDQLCAYGAGVTWLTLLFVDLKRAGIVSWSWTRIAPCAVAVCVAAGPGTAFVVGWFVRERLMIGAVGT